MPKLVCSSCGAEYTMAFAKDWGRNPLHAGHGNTPVCVELVPNGLVAPLPSDRTEEQCPMEQRIAKGVCRGQLMPTTGTAADGRP